MAYIIVGLGNPGGEYDNTRHNAGRMAVEAYAKKEGGKDVVWRDDKKANALVAKVGKDTLVLPNTFMNKSGSAVVKYVKSVKAAKNMVVVYDDLDLPLGRIKISFARSAGGHNGLKSVTRAVKTDEFIRIRIGVSPHTPKGVTKKPSGEDAVLKFILGKFAPKEADELKKTLKLAVEALGVILDDGYVVAMNKCN
jgi:PTH1 family peptidyl-tRNA hydrolase